MITILQSEQGTHNTSRATLSKPDTPRFLITIDVGIGDAVMVGLSAIDQIIANDPGAYGTIDILCNSVQAQLFADDPRINRIIARDSVFFPGIHMRHWLRGTVLHAEEAEVIRFLRARHYKGILPAIVAPGLFYRLHARIMYPNIPVLAKSLLTMRKQADMHMSTIVRQMVNRYFGCNSSQHPSCQDITLCIGREHLQRATSLLTKLKAQMNWREEDTIILVAPDTTSIVTRPPTNLLAPALLSILQRCSQTCICILPGYTNPLASTYLLQALQRHFIERVVMLPLEPRLPLLDVTALIDQVDAFVVGDTGLMHLAATIKRFPSGSNQHYAWRNACNTAALFGGTNPDLYGYPRRTIIVGKGRKEQMSFRPGFSKKPYNPRGRDLFDHILPQQVADAVITTLSL